MMNRAVVATDITVFPRRNNAETASLNKLDKCHVFPKSLSLSNSSFSPYWGFLVIATTSISPCKYYTFLLVPQGSNHIPIGASQLVFHKKYKI